jgi:glycosyltransferase involved in cell wall biosynthesis
VRVLDLVKGLDRGGAETLLLTGARHRYPAITSEIAYLSSRHDQLVDELTAEGVKVTCLAPGSMVDPRWLWRLRRALAEVDVTHSHSPVPATAARIVSRTIPRHRRPSLVTTEHNVWDSHHPLTRLAERITFKLDDAHLAVSTAVLESLPETYRPGVEVVRAGVDLDDVRSHADRTGIRTELGVSDDEVLIGTVANLRAQKGYPDLLRAARHVIDAVPNARFVAAGRGPQQGELEALHLDLGLGDRFRFLGHRADAVRVMSGLDLFCLASHHEGLPVALMEALALGLPVVSTRAGGIPELITDGDQGLLVDIGSVDALANALISEARNTEERATHARAALATGDQLSIKTSVKRTEDLYRTMVEAR